MKGLFFFVYLCFLLLRGYGYVYAGIHHNPVGYLAAQHFEANTRQDYTGIEGNGLNKEQECLISEDAEEEDGGEDDSHAFAGKNRLLTGGDLPHCNTFILNYLYGCTKDRLPFCNHLSDKYMIQMSLRI